MTKIIEVTNLSFSYGRHKIFDNISFQIEEGNFTTIIDADNNGKSTLANILACNLDSQNIKMFGKNVNSKNITNIRKKISFVSENIDGMFIVDNVLDNINFILKKRHLSEEIIHKKINEIIIPLKKKNLLRKNINELSLGEKYFIAIFIALASEPRLLILDNCFSMIDGVTKKKIFVLLKSLNKKGMTILNFTSDCDDCLEGTNILILSHSKILLSKPIEEAFLNLSVFEVNKISLPFVVDLSYKLKYYGKIEKICLDKKKLVDKIWQ